MVGGNDNAYLLFDEYTDTTTLQMTSVTFVSTPNDGTCGIGTYMGTLLTGLDSDVDVLHVTVPLGSWNPISYLLGAMEAGTAESNVIHVQHEYGIFGPKSLMSWLFFPLLYLVCWLRGKEVVVTLHSAWNDETIGPPFVSLKRVYVRFNNALIATVADHAVFLSENCKDRFLESASVSSYEVLAHGVQTETVDMDPAIAKERFGYDPDDIVVVEPGYVRPEKGYETFLNVADRLDDYKFLVAGGSQTDENDEYVAELSQKATENVRITGTLEDSGFHEAFIAADVILLPYREVTQSGVFNWCVAYGLPVVASDEEYFRNLHDEWDCVALFESGDADHAEATVRRLVADRDERNRLVGNMEAYRSAQSMDAVADDHVKIYHRLDPAH